MQDPLDQQDKLRTYELAQPLLTAMTLAAVIIVGWLFWDAL